MRQNTCAEDMLSFAYNKLTRGNLKFKTEILEQSADLQIDLSDNWVWTTDEDSDCRFTQTTYQERLDEFRSYLNKIDKSKVYFVRTGYNNGAGHWQCLHFVEDIGWELYSSIQNRRMITNADSEFIIENVEASLFGNAKGTLTWGSSNGQYSILIKTATLERIVAATNYISKLRMGTSIDVARESTWDIKEFQPSRYVTLEGTKPDPNDLDSVDIPQPKRTLVDVEADLSVAKPAPLAAGSRVFNLDATITLAHLKACLDKYESKNWYAMLVSFVSTLTFGFVKKHRSGTIRALDELHTRKVNERVNQVSVKEITTELEKINNWTNFSTWDSQQLHRISLFQGIKSVDKNTKSATDLIIDEMINPVQYRMENA